MAYINVSHFFCLAHHDALATHFSTSSCPLRVTLDASLRPRCSEEELATKLMVSDNAMAQNNKR